METLTLITNALRSIGVLDFYTAPAAEQGEHALTNLNQLMASLAEDGIDLGYAPTDAITDDIILPLGHVAAIEAMLALKEASDRGIEPPATLRYIADQGRQRLLGRAVSAQIEHAQSDTLPRGSAQRSTFNILTG